MLFDTINFSYEKTGLDQRQRSDRRSRLVVSRKSLMVTIQLTHSSLVTSDRSRNFSKTFEKFKPSKYTYNITSCFGVIVGQSPQLVVSGKWLIVEKQNLKIPHQ
jgi:hypothetical protein